MNSFKLSELSESTLVGRDIGKITREKIQILLKEHSEITIDMENKSSISPSFLDEAIVMLVIEYGKENFNKRIKLININNGIKNLMNTILHDKLHRSSM
ncbi:MAG: STAS-like domain-containing protein [Sulfurimonas sp.]